MYCIWSDQYTSGRVSVNTMNDLSIKPIIFRARIREYINKFKKLLYVNYMYVTSHPLAEEIQIFFFVSMFVYIYQLLMILCLAHHVIISTSIPTPQGTGCETLVHLITFKIAIFIYLLVLA